MGGKGRTDKVWRQGEQIRCGGRENRSEAIAITRDRDDVVLVRVIAVE